MYDNFGDDTYCHALQIFQKGFPLDTLMLWELDKYLW